MKKRDKNKLVGFSYSTTGDAIILAIFNFNPAAAGFVI